jgi:hypothetical protein
MRHRDPETSHIRDCFPRLAASLRILMGVVFAAIALGATMVVMLAFMGHVGAPHLEPAILIWVTVTPIAVNASLRLLRRQSDQPILEIEEEIGLAYCLLAGVCFLGSMTLLRDPTDPEDWDSFRMVLRVGSVLSCCAAGLVVCSPRCRRLMLSLVIVLHFCAIASAVLAQPPASRIGRQTWMRFFRPYLTFMNLNDSYQYYSPDPEPSNYLWFRIIYASEDGKTDVGKWYKLPAFDEEGCIKHPVRLEYQRYLSMTGRIAEHDSAPPEVVFNEEMQEWQWQPMYLRRLKLSDPNAPIDAAAPDANQPRIPLHPEITKTAQVNVPASMPKRLLSSFARHLSNKYPTHVAAQGNTLNFKSVKIYCVIHSIPPVEWYQSGLSPTDPVLYHPFYLGNYRADGMRINDGDPYLWWLLPILRENPNQPKSRIFDYCRYHAGDPDWKMELADWK